MRRSTLIVPLAATLLLCAGAHAQRTSVQLRGSHALPTGRLAGTELDDGVGLGATISQRVQPHLHLYAGWDWLHFQPAQSFAGDDMDFEETGYTFGLAFQHPWGWSRRFGFRLEGGGTYKHVEIENADGDIIEDSGHELGYEAAAGVVATLGRSWAVSPMWRYRWQTPEFDIGNVRTNAKLRYFALELGVIYRFNRGNEPVTAATRQ
jgi:hypothetical protein